VVADKAERVARFQRQTLMGLREIVVAMGLDDPWQIKPCDLSERIGSARASPVDRIYTFLDDGQLLADPEATPYARYWEAARADSFRRAA